MDPGTEALFLASHPALDFLNSRYTPAGGVVDVIGDGRALLDWLERAGHIDLAARARLKTRLDPATLDAAAAEARKLRNWAAAWLERWCERPRAPYPNEVRRLNQLLAGASNHAELVSAAEGWQLAQTPRLTSTAELLALLAAPLAQLVSDERPDLVKRCAGPGCTLWFLDRSKAHRRVFCSPEACGNRAKVAAFRERQRS